MMPEPMITIRPMKIPGRWRDGYALDAHTVRSVYLGEDEYGNPTFDTERSEIGESLYQLKYRGDLSVVPPIVEAAATFVSAWSPGAEVLVPVPPTRSRTVQPVRIIVEALAERLAIPAAMECVRRVRGAPELKNVFDFDERLRALAGAHEIDRTQVEGRRVLLFDDLYRSGATLNELTAALYDRGGAAEVYALTITQTRSRR